MRKIKIIKIYYEPAGSINEPEPEVIRKNVYYKKIKDKKSFKILEKKLEKEYGGIVQDSSWNKKYIEIWIQK